MVPFTTNLVGAAVSPQVVSLVSQVSYQQGRYERLQHEADFLEVAVLIFFSLFTITFAALLLARGRSQSVNKAQNL